MDLAEEPTVRQSGHHYFNTKELRNRVGDGAATRYLCNCLGSSYYFKKFILSSAGGVELRGIMVNNIATEQGQSVPFYWMAFVPGFGSLRRRRQLPEALLENKFRLFAAPDDNDRRALSVVVKERNFLLHLTSSHPGLAILDAGETKISN